VASPAWGTGASPLDFQQFHFSLLWSKSDNQPTVQVLCSLLMQMSTTHSAFDQYCISHKTISHRSADAPSPEVQRECPIT